MFKIDFNNWDEDLFFKVDKTLRTNFRNYFMDYRIYFSRASKTGNILKMFLILLVTNKNPPWPEDEFKEYIGVKGGEFQLCLNYRFLIYYDKNIKKGSL